MTLEDFLLPSENIVFSSAEDVEFTERKYKIIITDRRLVLYSRRGLLFKSDDIVSKRLDSINDVKYREGGFLFRQAAVSIWSDSKMEIRGSVAHMKPLFQMLQSVTNKK